VGPVVRPRRRLGARFDAAYGQGAALPPYDGTIGVLARLWNPVTGEIEVANASDGDTYNYFCSGHSILPDGRVLITGGQTEQGILYGEQRTAFFDPATETWEQGPMMARPRWYPSNVTLPDSHVLVLSGSENPTPFVEEVERYDVASNRFSTLGPTASWTARFLYPRLFLLADGTVARVGMERQTRYLDPVTETWSNGPSLNYGDRENGTMIRLAGNRVLPIGGSHGGLPTSSTEIIDFDDPTPAWTYSGEMAEPRQHLNAVLLPDGTVLAVGELDRPTSTTTPSMPPSSTTPTRARGRRSTPCSLRGLTTRRPCCCPTAACSRRARPAAPRRRRPRSIPRRICSQDHGR